MSSIHLVDSFALAAFALLHVAGALKHVADGSGVLRRMLPGAR